MTSVMVVDDEKFVREGIVQGTDWRRIGCEVVGQAKNGEEALALARTLHPALIITDIRMPKMDGIELVRALRTEHLEFKVIFLTAYSDFSYAQQAIRLQASDYLLKPFEDGALEAAIQKLLGEEILHGGAVASKKDAEILPLKETGPEMNRYVQDAIAYIEAHYSEDDISITKIAEAIGVSEGHLSRLFKKDTAQSMNNYITCYRMRSAMRLLREARYKVYEVCEMVGYHDLAYFSSTFKKLTGMTPSDYQTNKE